MSKGQYSYLLLRAYLNSNEEAQTLALEVAEARHYAFIVHDKDVWHDSNEEHNEGEPKKAHYHFVLNLASAISPNALRNKILKAYPKCGAYVTIPNDGEASVDYLTHSTPKAIAEKKHRYPVEDVISDDYAYFRSKTFTEGVREEKKDPQDEFVQKVLELGYCPRPLLLEYGRTLGKSFRYNYRKELQFIADVLNVPLDQIFIEPEKRWDIVESCTSVRAELEHMIDQKQYMEDVIIHDCTKKIIDNVTKAYGLKR